MTTTIPPKTKNNIRRLLFSCVLLCSISTAWAQIKVGDNPTAVDPYTVFEAESTNKGVLFPRMSTAQREAAFTGDQPIGLLIYNTTIHCLEVYTASGWQCSSASNNNGGELALSLDGNVLHVGDSSIDLSSLAGSPSQQTSVVLNGDQLQIGDNSIDLSVYTNTDSQTLSINGQTLSISGGNSVILPSSGGGGSTQSLALAGNNLTISGGNTVVLPTVTNTNSQTLTANLNTNSLTLSISGGNSQTIDLSTISSVEDQQLTASALSANNTLTLAISDGNTVTLDLSSLQTAAGTAANNTLRWDGSAWVENATLVSDGAAQATVTTNFAVGGSTTLTGDTTAQGSTTLQGALVDSTGSAGSSGQILSSTGTVTLWIAAGASPIQLQSATYNAGIDDGTILVEPTGATTINLPAITAADNGKKLTIKRANAYAGTGDTLAVAAAANMDDNGGNYNLNVSYQGYTFQAFNSAWHIVARF